MVTKTTFCLLLKLLEIGLLEVVVIYYPKFYLKEARRVITHNFNNIILCAHLPVNNPKDLVIPLFASKEAIIKLKNHINMWYNFNNHILENCPQLPLKIIQNGSQVYYSKIKTGVNRTLK